MSEYYVNKNKQPNGDNEVHVKTCSWFNLIKDKEYLGNYSRCSEAVSEAKRKNYNANGCKYCAPSCHTS